MKNINPKDRKTDELGFSDYPLCREPWESYYILRRGILPCCHGNPILAPMDDWKEAWNSPELKEIRRSLSQGKLSEYCMVSYGCPIVQREMAKAHSTAVPKRPKVLRLINRLFLGLPKKFYLIFRPGKH